MCHLGPCLRHHIYPQLRVSLVAVHHPSHRRVAQDVRTSLPSPKPNSPRTHPFPLSFAARLPRPLRRLLPSLAADVSGPQARRSLFPFRLFQSCSRPPLHPSITPLTWTTKTCRMSQIPPQITHNGSNRQMPSTHLDCHEQVTPAHVSRYSRVRTSFPIPLPTLLLYLWLKLTRGL